MNKISRNILFIVFVTFFLVAAPLIVLYTAGIKYNPSSGDISRTGVISVTSLPRSADLILDDFDIDHNTPYVIKNLDPGEYNLEIAKDGYHPWNGNVEVRGSETTFVQNIILFLNATPELHVEKLPSNISRSPDKNTFAYFEETELGSYKLITWDAKNNRMMRAFETPTVTNPDNYSIDWSATGKHILVSSNISRDFSVLSLSSNELDLSELLTEDIDKIFWHPSTEDLLYLSSPVELRQINLATSSVEIFAGENLNSAVIDASLITFFNNSGQVELRQTVGDETNLIALLPLSEYTIIDRHGQYLMIGDKRGELFLVNIRSDQPLLLESKATLYDWLEAEQLLVYSDGNEINVYDPKTHSIEFITRQGERITSVNWHGPGNAIIATTQNSVKAIETFKTAEERLVTDLLTDTKIETFWLADDSKQAYIFSEDKLYTLELTK